jgi:hypothetical protein
VVFEGPDGSLRFVASVIAWWNGLDSNPWHVVAAVLLEEVRRFVVHALVRRGDSERFKENGTLCIGFDVVGRAAGCHQNGVDVISAYHDHEVLHSSLAGDGEASSEIRVAYVR